MGLEARGVLSKRKRVNFKRVRNGVVSERLNVLVEGSGNEGCFFNSFETL